MPILCKFVNVFKNKKITLCVNWRAYCVDKLL